jgi:hypothetical protein
MNTNKEAPVKRSQKLNKFRQELRLSVGVRRAEELVVSLVSALEVDSVDHLLGELMRLAAQDEYIETLDKHFDELRHHLGVIEKVQYDRGE